MIIRSEKTLDYTAIRKLLTDAFATEEHSDHLEGELVDRIRQSDSYLPELSLVAVQNEKIIGHIMLSLIKLRSPRQEFGVLALGPLSVAPHLQKNGIGGSLIKEAEKRAELKGFKLILVLGHPTYYQRFGYQPANKLGIVSPFDVPADCFMAKALKNIGLMEDKQYEVVYPSCWES